MNLANANGISYWLDVAENGEHQAAVNYLLSSSYTSLVIPETITVDEVEYVVREIYSLAYFHNEDLHPRTSIYSLSLPSTLRYIFSFDECRGLSDLVLNDGLDSIGEAAFYNCSNLNSVTIPCSIKKIGEGAFEKCSSLSTIVYRNYHEMDFKTGSFTFEQNKIKNIVFEGTVYSKKSADMMVWNLDCDDNYLHRYVTATANCCQDVDKNWIGWWDCSGYSGQELKECQDGLWFYQYNFTENISYVTRTIGSGSVKVSGSTATEGKEYALSCGTANITLTAEPNNGFLFYKWVDQFGYEWYDQTVTVHVGGPKHTFTAVFVAIPETVSFEKDGLKYTYNSDMDELTMTGLVEGTKQITLKKEIEFDVIPSVSMKREVTFTPLKGNNTLEKVTFDGTVENIPAEMFMNCTNLKYASCEGVKEIGESAFKNDGKLELVMLTDVSQIYASTFENCEELSSFFSWNSLTDVYQYAFQNCAKLTSFDFSLLENIGANAFYGAGLVGDVELTSTLSIEDGGLMCPKVNRFIIRNSLPVIFSSPFPNGSEILIECDLMAMIIDESSPWNAYNFMGISNNQITINVETPSGPCGDCAWVSRYPDCFGNAEVTTTAPDNLINPVFKGWFDMMNMDETPLSTNETYQFVMTENKMLLARWEGLATALDQITNDQMSNVKSQMSNKIIKDNHLLILRGGRTYTITGQEVK